jgi:predicted glycosyltransferase
MAREAALLGTPGISMFDRIIGIDSALAKIGFPIYYSESYDVTLKMVKDIIKNPDRYRVDTKSMLEKLESPWPIILRWVKRLLRS